MFNGLGYLAYSYLIITLYALAVLPWSMVLFRNLSGAWFVFARPMGAMAITFFPWFISSILPVPHTQAFILLVFLSLLISSGLYVWLRKDRLVSIFRRDWKDLAIAEGVFLLLFFFFALSRAYEPKIFGTEKGMDLMFLRGLIRATTMPPYDPWFTGGTINYYYGGYLVFATMAKTFGIHPDFMYNIAFSLIGAMGGAGAFILARNLSGRRTWALFAPFFVCVMGNLHAVGQWLGKPEVKTVFDINWWAPSRVVKDFFGNQHHETINEFPMFSFHLADLHPHVVSIPFIVLFLGVLYTGMRFLWNRKFTGKDHWQFWGVLTPTLGLTLGFMGFVNGLDLPIFMLLLIAMAFFAYLLFLTSIRRLRQNFLGNTFAVGDLVGTAVVVAFLTAAPFLLRFVKPYQDMKMLEFTDYKSGAGQILTVWGLHFFLVISYLLFAYSEVLRRHLHCGVHPEKTPRFNPDESRDRILLRKGLWTLVGALFAAVGIFLLMRLNYIMISVLPLVVAALGVLLYVERRSPSRFFITATLGFAVAVIVGCEVFYIPDRYGQGLQRMNTLFKFYYQAWVVFGCVLPAVMAYLWASRKWIGRGVSAFVLVVSILLFLGSMVYPVGATGARLREQIRTFQNFAKMDLEGIYGDQYHALIGELNGQFPDKAPVQNREPHLVSRKAAERLRRIDRPRWERRRNEFLTLDGGIFLHREHPADAGAMDWLNKNVKGSPVILEWPGTAYAYNGRFATYTGLPTVLGWENHENIWRSSLFYFAGREKNENNKKEWGKIEKWTRKQNDAREANRAGENWPAIGERASDVRRIYQAASLNEIRHLLERYGIEYIILAELELQNLRTHEGTGFPGPATRKFEEFEIVYSASNEPDAVRIYRVSRSR